MPPRRGAPARAAPTRAAPTRAVPTRAAPTRAAPTRAAPTRAAPARAARTRNPPSEVRLFDNEATRKWAENTVNGRRDAYKAMMYVNASVYLKKKEEEAH